MIPPWREAVVQAGALLAPGGTLHIVDFGDQGQLPSVFRKGLRAWLELFSVHPRTTLESELGDLARQRGWDLQFTPLFRRYAFLAALKASA